MSEVENSEMNGEHTTTKEEENGDMEMEETMDTQDTQVMDSYDDQQQQFDDAQEEVVMTPSNNTIPCEDHKLFVGGLSQSTTEQTLRDYFSQFGKINEVNLKSDRNTGKSRGFAFVIFDKEEALDKTVAASPHVLDDKEIDAKKAIPHVIHQAMKNRTKKVFVGGVPTDMPEDTIRNYFSTFGPIEEVALVTEKGEKKRRGFCFVTFENEDCAEEACSKSFHKIEGAEVEVKRATPRELDNKRQSHFIPPNYMGRGRGNFSHPPGGRGGHWAPYGGHAAYYSFYPAPPPPYGGGYMGGGYGGYGAYGGYGYEPYRGRDDAGYNSRYGPMRTNNFVHNHSHHNHGHAHHPYSR